MDTFEITFLQNAVTIKLVGANGKPVPVTALNEGDEPMIITIYTSPGKTIKNGSINLAKSIATPKSMMTGEPVPGAEVYIELEEPDEPIWFNISTSPGKTIKNGSINYISMQYSTPELSFSKAEEKLKGLWFASLISIDFSPSVTRIRFPDGHSEKVNEQITIQSINYAQGKGSFAVSGKSDS